MPIFARAEFWNEFYAAGGFWVGVAGGIIGVVGFWYTILQVRKTKSAAEAAEQAASAAAQEAKSTFRRFVIGQAHAVFSELGLLVQHEHWEPSALRAEDLAKLLAQVGEGSDTVNELVDLLRDSAVIMTRKARLASARFPSSQWVETTKQIRAFLDRATAPY